MWILITELSETGTTSQRRRIGSSDSQSQGSARSWFSASVVVQITPSLRPILQSDTGVRLRFQPVIFCPDIGTDIHILFSAVSEKDITMIMRSDHSDVHAITLPVKRHIRTNGSATPGHNRRTEVPAAGTKSIAATTSANRISSISSRRRKGELVQG